MIPRITPNRSTSNYSTATPKPPKPKSPIKAPTRSPRPPEVAPRPNKAQDSSRNNDAHDGQAKRKRGVSLVTDLVNSEIRSGVQSLRQDRRIARRQAKNDRQQTLADYQRSLGDLNYVYGEAGDYIQNMGQQINQGYNDRSSQAAAAQQQFVQSLQGNSTQIGGGLSSELSRLGLQGVDNSQFMADAQNAQNVAGQMGVNAQANIGLQQQGANNISSLLGGMVQGSHLSNVGQANNAKNDLLFQVYQNKHDAYDQVAEAISDLKGTRGDLTLQMMQQLGSSPWGKYLHGGGKKRKSHGRSSRGYSSHYTSGGSSSSGGSSGSTGDKPTGGNALAQLLMGALNGTGPRRTG